MDVPQLVHGRVRSIDIASKSLVIFDDITSKLYSIKFEGFLPARDSDVLLGIVLNENGMYTFYKKPFIQLSTDKESIIKCIIKGVNYNIANSLATKIYDNLLIANQGTPVNEVLNQMSIDLHDKQIDNFSILPNFLQSAQIFKLLKYWYKTRTMRQLHLLGLTDTEIKKCEEMSGLTPTQIYEQCVINPFKMIPIPIDKCKIIMDITDTNYTEEDITYATIVRKMYLNCNDKSWVGTPSKYIFDQFRNIDMAKLKEEYKVEIEFNTLYLEHHYKIEKKVSEALCAMIKTDRQKELNAPSEIKAQFHDPRLTDEQKNAVGNSLNKYFSIIKGEAGSGKSTIILEITKNLEILKIPYAVAAFTGKAVARNKEILQNNIPMTLHMMIARKKQMNPFKFLIIDEASNLSTELLYYVFKSFGYDFQLCLIGDENQLPPISWGNLFTEILDSGVVTPSILPRSHRCTLEEATNDINHNSRMLIDNYKMRKSGMRNVPPVNFRTGNNFHRLEGDLSTVLEIVSAFYSSNVDASKIVVITPYIRYLDEINKGIQYIYTQGRPQVKDQRGLIWALGDKVIINSNNYNLGLMNGDEGIVSDVNMEIGKSGYRQITIDFKSGQSFRFDVTYDPEDTNVSVDVNGDNYMITNNPTLSLLTHSYAITVHKSQGSQWEFVIGYMPKNEKDSSFVNFNLIYPWLTRPEVSMFLVGDLQAFDLNCTREPPFRVDNLGKRLKAILNTN